MKKYHVMNFIKGMLFVAVLMPFGASAQQQQQRPSAEDRAKMQTQMMKTQFNLTDDQVAKVNDVNLKYAKQMEATMSDNTITDKRAAMMQMSQNKETDFKAVLTPDQFQKYQAMEQQRKNGRMGRPQGAMQPGGAAPQTTPDGK